MCCKYATNPAAVWRWICGRSYTFCQSQASGTCADLKFVMLSIGFTTRPCPLEKFWLGSLIWRVRSSLAVMLDTGDWHALSTISLWVTLPGGIILVDCGEGTQHHIKARICWILNLSREENMNNFSLLTVYTIYVLLFGSTTVALQESGPCPGEW